MDKIFTFCENESQIDFHSLCVDKITDGEFYAPMEPGDVFRYIMEKELDLTQEEVAERLKCSVGKINMAYTGERGMKTKWIKEICDTFNIPIERFFVKSAASLKDKDREGKINIEDEDKQVFNCIDLFKKWPEDRQEEFLLMTDRYRKKNYKKEKRPSINKALKRG